jgi:hypothetical protein
MPTSALIMESHHRAKRITSLIQKQRRAKRGLLFKNASHTKLTKMHVSVARRGMELTKRPVHASHASTIANSARKMPVYATCAILGMDPMVTRAKSVPKMQIPAQRSPP